MARQNKPTYNRKFDVSRYTKYLESESSTTTSALVNHAYATGIFKGAYPNLFVFWYKLPNRFHRLSIRIPSATYFRTVKVAKALGLVRVVNKVVGLNIYEKVKPVVG